jgi:LmbE family N-acetylglucosaminyl deacetylase
MPGSLPYFSDRFRSAARLIEEIRPDTVVTFDPTGVTGHLDHRAVTGWVLQAVRGHPGLRVLGAAVTENWVAHMDGLVDLGEYFYPGFPRPVAQEDVALELVCDDELWAIKDAAIRAHHTQVAGIADDVPNDVWRAFNDVEAFIDLTPHCLAPAAGPDTGRITTGNEPISKEST